MEEEEVAEAGQVIHHTGKLEQIQCSLHVLIVIRRAT